MKSPPTIDDQMLIAARHGQFAQVLSRLRSGAHINAQDRYGRTALHWMVVYLNRRMVNSLIEEFRANPAIVDDEHNTPLHLAALLGLRRIAEDLVGHHAPLTHPASGGNHGYPPHICASIEGHVALGQWLRHQYLRQMAAVSAKDTDEAYAGDYTWNAPLVAHR